MAMEAEYLEEEKIDRVKLNRWAEGFDPNKYEIPTNSLPPHPIVKEAEVRDLTRSKLEGIKNDRLRELLTHKKQ